MGTIHFINEAAKKAHNVETLPRSKANEAPNLELLEKLRNEHTASTIVKTLRDWADTIEQGKSKSPIRGFMSVFMTEDGRAVSGGIGRVSNDDLLEMNKSIDKFVVKQITKTLNKE